MPNNVKMIMAIGLYVALVTLVVNSVASTNTSSGIAGYNNFLTYNYYTNFQIDGINFSSLDINTISGSWTLDKSLGLHATNLVLKNPLYFLPFIGQSPIYEAECTFGKISVNNNFYTESFNVTGIGLNSGDNNKFLMVDMNTPVIITSDMYQWWLVTNNNELWIQSAAKQIGGIMEWQDLGNNVENLGLDGYFTRNYDTGYRFSKGVGASYKLAYTVQFNNYKNAVISVYVDNVQVYSNDIPLTWIGNIDFASNILNSNNRQTDIKTNNYDFSIQSTSQIISSKQIDRGFDVWGLFDNIFNIMTFQVDASIVPQFLQFLFFGIYDIGLLYLLAALVRGTSG